LALKDLTGVCVWDATMGEVIVGLFTGHTSGVNSVAFLLDGQWIALALFDGMIHVWDATTGEVIVGPFTRYTNLVFSDAQQLVQRAGLKLLTEV
jgi:WD40 repeat protein